MGLGIAANNDGPITGIVTRTAKKDRIKEFEVWMDGMIREAMGFEGHMGVSVVRPADLLRPEYAIIFRFNSYENLQKWERSPERKKWLDKSKEVIEGEPKEEVQSGLEFWFTPHSNKNGGPLAPPRYKMAIVTVGIISILLITLVPAIEQVTEGHLPFLPRTLLVTTIMVLLMTYIVMPSVTRVLRPWLSKKTLF